MCVVLESLNFISNKGFTEFRGKLVKFGRYWHFLPFFRHFGGNIGGHKDYFPFVIFNFVYLIVLQLFYSCNGFCEGETPTIVEVSLN